jgi:hypothetical protein
MSNCQEKDTDHLTETEVDLLLEDLADMLFDRYMATLRENASNNST